MEVRTELTEFLQNVLRETPNIELEWKYIMELSKYEVKLWIVAQEWLSDPADTILEAKNQVMRKALDELKELRTERAIRIRLRMGLWCRNEYIKSIRDAAKSLKKLYKDNETRHLIPILARIYPILEELERNMQKRPFCTLPPRGSPAWYDLYGMPRPPQASAMEELDEVSNSDLSVDEVTED